LAKTLVPTQSTTPAAETSPAASAAATAHTVPGPGGLSICLNLSHCGECKLVHDLGGEDLNMKASSARNDGNNPTATPTTAKTATPCTTLAASTSKTTAVVDTLIATPVPTIRPARPAPAPLQCTTSIPSFLSTLHKPPAPSQMSPRRLQSTITHPFLTLTRDAPTRHHRGQKNSPHPRCFQRRRRFGTTRLVSPPPIELTARPSPDLALSTWNILLAIDA